MTIAQKLEALADNIGQGAYHKLMALLGAHPKTVSLCALGAGFVIGLWLGSAL